VETRLGAQVSGAGESPGFRRTLEHKPRLRWLGCGATTSKSPWTSKPFRNSSGTPVYKRPLVWASRWPPNGTLHDTLEYWKHGYRVLFLHVFWSSGVVPVASGRVLLGRRLAGMHRWRGTGKDSGLGGEGSAVQEGSRPKWGTKRGQSYVALKVKYGKQEESEVSSSMAGSLASASTRGWFERSAAGALLFAKFCLPGHQHRASSMAWRV